MAITRNLLEIGNAQILFPNFSGREKKAMVNGVQRIVNDEGHRNFNVSLDPEKSDIYWNGERVTDPHFGQQLAELGFNVTVKPGREEGDLPQYRLPVHIAYDNFPPELYIISGCKKTLLDESTISCLDNSDIISADLRINNGKSYIKSNGEEGVKAWCNVGYFTVAQNRFASKYDFEEGEQ